MVRELKKRQCIFPNSLDAITYFTQQYIYMITGFRNKTCLIRHMCNLFH